MPPQSIFGHAIRDRLHLVRSDALELRRVRPRLNPADINPAKGSAVTCALLCDLRRIMGRRFATAEHVHAQARERVRRYRGR